MDAISEGLRKLILAGIGAVAATKEKSEVILDELVKKGELTVEQGKVLNEELKHNIKDAIRENVTLHVVTPEDNRGEADGDETDDTADFVLDAVDSLTDEQKEIGEIIIGNLGSSGYLRASVEEIAEMASTTPEQSRVR